MYRIICVIIFVSLLPGCSAQKKMIFPKDDRGVNCIKLIEDVKVACLEERNIEIAKCNERNIERKRVSEEEAKLYRDKSDNLSPDEKLKNSLMVGLLVGVRQFSQLEDCSNLTKHCEEEYRENFTTKCKGRIE